MPKIHVGQRIAREGKIAVCCSASVLNDSREKMLLIRRADNNRWAVPGGFMEPGESLTEACKREVLEETGYSVDVSGLIGVYTSPNLLLEYADGNKWQLVVLHFEAEVNAGDPALGSETSEVGFFTATEAEKMEMSPLDHKRMVDGFNGQKETKVCDDFIFGMYTQET